MAWESRQRGGPYYTRSKRVNGQVVREYVGGGELARIVAEQDTINRTIREARRKRERNELERLKTADAAVEEFCKAVDSLTRAALVAAGYRNHKGGQWRRKRGG
jgi:hypothetical protein